MEIVRDKNIIVLGGFNLRYHPSLIKIKEILETEQLIGKVVSARVQCGQYLPDWHPYEDYRKGYSARSELGGGILLDGIHEIDYLRWFLGEAKEVFAFIDKLSSLEIDTEDTVEMLIRYESGVIGEVHLDYIQRAKSRTCEIIGEEGSIVWDINKARVELYRAEDKKWEIFPLREDFEYNDLYIDEIKYFIECIEKGEKAYPDEIDGKKVLEIAIAAKKSSQNGILVKIQ